VKASAYHLMMLAEKRDSARRRRDLRFPRPHLFTCRLCGAGVPAEQASSHAARCPKREKTS
jgi:hypothetical protein